MKKFILSTLLAILSSPVFADMTVNTTNCTLNGANDLGMCYQNKTGANIGGSHLFVTQSRVFKNGGTEVNKFVISTFQPERFIGISTSLAQLRARNITQEVYTFAIDANNIVSCTVNIQSTYHQYPKLRVIRQGNTIACAT